MLTDLRFVWRVFAHNRHAFTAVIALLGIAVGSTIAALAAMDALILHPLPVRNQNRIVTMGGLAYETPIDPLAWWGQANAFDAIAVYAQGETTVDGSGGKRREQAVMVSSAFFRVFGVRLFLGRDFARHGDGRRVAILSYSFWRSYFGGRRSALGADLRINQAPYRVIGVAPRAFVFPPGAELWLPRPPTTASAKKAAPEFVPPAQSSTGGAASTAPLPEPLPPHTMFHWVGRLRLGVEIDEARSQLSALLNRLNGKYTRKTRVVYGQLISVRPVREMLAANAKPAMRAVLAAAILVLLIAAANCCLFLLGRATTRRTETAVRQALGASRRRILRQVLTELLALGTACGLVAFAISAWLLTTIQKLLPAYLVEPSQPLSASSHTFLYCLLLCILISLLAGLAPALQSTGPTTLEALKDYSGPLAGGRGPLLRRLMVVIEAAVAVVLVLGAILSARTFINLTEVDPGYSPKDVFVIHMTFPRARFNDQRFLARRRELLDLLKESPGVAGAAASSVLPTAGATGGAFVRRRNAYTFCLVTLVGGDYFRALGIPLIAGRRFSEGDRDAVIISATAARELWRGGSPVGGVVHIDGEDAPRRVVAVVRDTRGISLEETVQPQIYLPYSQPYRDELSSLSIYLLARCGLGRAGCASLLMQRVNAAARDAEIDRYASLAEAVETATGPVQARAALMVFYGLLGAALAWLGVYSLVSYLAAVRNYEMGVRMTFGAQASGVVLLLSSEAIVCAGAGLIVGVVASFGAVRILSNLLFGVKPMDPASFAVAAFVMLVGAVAACLVPALRVARCEPWEILRSR